MYILILSLCAFACVKRIRSCSYCQVVLDTSESTTIEVLIVAGHLEVPRKTFGQVNGLSRRVTLWQKCKGQYHFQKSRKFLLSNNKVCVRQGVQNQTFKAFDKLASNSFLTFFLFEGQLLSFAFCHWKNNSCRKLIKAFQGISKWLIYNNQRINKLPATPENPVQSLSFKIWKIITKDCNLV